MPRRTASPRPGCPGPVRSGRAEARPPAAPPPAARSSPRATPSPPPEGGHPPRWRRRRRGRPSSARTEGGVCGHRLIRAAERFQEEGALPGGLAVEALTLEPPDQGGEGGVVLRQG